MIRKHNKDLVPDAKELRLNMTKQERHLWYDFLRDYPVKFLRQKVFGYYILDFYCAKAKLVIEIDGVQHLSPDNMKYDAQRTAFLKQYDLKVVRFSNGNIDNRFDEACSYIDLLVRQRTAED